MKHPIEMMHKDTNKYKSGVLYFKPSIPDINTARIKEHNDIIRNLREPKSDGSPFNLMLVSLGKEMFNTVL